MKKKKRAARRTGNSNTKVEIICYLGKLLRAKKGVVSRLGKYFPKQKGAWKWDTDQGDFIKVNMDGKKAGNNGKIKKIILHHHVII